MAHMRRNVYEINYSHLGFSPQKINSLLFIDLNFVIVYNI